MEMSERAEAVGRDLARGRGTSEINLVAQVPAQVELWMSRESSVEPRLGGEKRRGLAAWAWALRAER